jgi:hypothetical protein
MTDSIERLRRMTKEILLEHKRTSPDDSPDDARIRATLAEEIAEIVRRGGIVDIPGEWP